MAVKIRELRVAQGAAIVLPSGRLATAGNVISLNSEGVERHHVEEWMKSKHIEEGREALPEVFTGKPAPGTEVIPLPGAPTKNGDDGLSPERAVQVIDGPARLSSGSSNPGAIKVSTVSTAPAAKDVPSGSRSKWVFDPEILSGKSLEELNVFAAQHQSDITPFEDRDEAIAFLSQDFVPDETK